MENKYRSFPPAVPLKITKLLEYQYFAEIYKKYDCNFFRQILPYFSEITTTNKLQVLKFIYVPIENAHKIQRIQIGMPFLPQVENKNPNMYQLSHEVTFIKITYQTHIIFEYLMNLNLSSIPIQRLKFQDKFWLFSEGVVKNLSFNDLVYRNQQQNQQGVIFILDGDFKCLNNQKKAYKTISKGYLIDSNGKLKKVRYEQLMSTKVCLEDSQTTPTQKSKVNSVIQHQDEYQQILHSIWSSSNNAKVLFIDLNVIKKYTLNFDDLLLKNQTVTQNNKLKPLKKQQGRPDIKSFMKYRRLKTQKQQNFGRSTYHNNQTGFDKLNKKFNLISCRTSSTVGNQIILNPIQQISDNQVLKSYTKDNELYKKMRRQISQRKHRKYFSALDKQKSGIKQQLLPFFKQELKNEKQKTSLKRRKTKQLWTNLNNISNEKQNFILMTKKIIQDIHNTKQNINCQGKKIFKTKQKKINKIDINAYQLLKRNLFNKQYHNVDFVQLNC